MRALYVVRLAALGMVALNPALRRFGAGGFMPCHVPLPSASQERSGGCKPGSGSGGAFAGRWRCFETSCLHLPTYDKDKKG